MKTVNSYVRIFKERLEYIKGKKEKEEESKLNNPLPTIIPEQDVGETTGNGINFEILPNWEGSRDENDIRLRGVEAFSKFARTGNGGLQ